jgi:uncharacterized protein (DUF305 family)
MVLGSLAPAWAQTNPAMADYQAAMMKMHQASPGQSSGDADVDFVRMMIPHHQAAIDMAKAQLKYGKDPAIRKLSQDIIAAQEKEIAEMNAWLARRKK